MKPSREGASEPFALDRRQMRRGFERASRSYDRAAILQTEVRQRLLSRLEYVRLEPELIVDAGCGTGHAARELKRRFPRARVVALDIATGMLREATHQQGWRRRFERVCADAERMPLPDESVDLIFSNLMLQWCDVPDGVLREVQRVLKPRGLLTFSTLGPDTLMELRAAWAAVDERPHVSRFIDMHDLGDALVRARLAEPVLDVERFTLTYDTAIALMRDLKAIGAQNATAGRPSGLTGRARFAAVTAAYERFRIAGRLPATYEVVLGHAWGAVSREGEVRVPLSQISRRAPSTSLREN
ncbi:MAG TPA: malonyl-ACP O-methyltransferase BioC [Steroidobacteraceae bacterium]|nr:malonyl-ACP O-methyltransferase BioC [Steroidobacteraceae bacterium]